MANKKLYRTLSITTITADALAFDELDNAYAERINVEVVGNEKEARKEFSENDPSARIRSAVESKGVYYMTVADFIKHATRLDPESERKYLETHTAKDED